MAKTIQSTLDQNPGLYLVLSFFTLFAVNSIVLYCAHLLFPQHVVIGTHALNVFWGIFHSMGKLALINTLVIPFVTEYETRRNKIFSSTEWMVTYFVVNFVTIWLITRFSEQFGLGITSWIIALLLAAALDVAQGLVMMGIEKLRTK